MRLSMEDAVGRFEGKVVWITGGGSGIGEAAALTFAKAGAARSGGKATTCYNPVGAPRSWDRTNPQDDMRSGSAQRPPGGRYNGNRPFPQQQRTPQRGQTFDSNGPNIKIRGSAHQIFERYVALAREA